MEATRLKTEYLYDPLGLGCRHPRFFWNCENGLTQTAYELYMTTDNSEPFWTTGKVDSPEMTAIPYEGPALKSRQRVCWQVRLWDENGAPGPWSEKAWFEMGLLEPADWSAKWITSDYIPEKKHRYPADEFLKSFKVARSIQKARLYITACGIYDACINGRPAVNFLLAPGFTDYRRRLHYQTYDVTALLHTGTNSLTVTLGDGWYRGSIGAMGVRNFYGSQTRFMAQLEITFEDKTRQVIISDEHFLWSNDGPVRFNDLKDGAIVDMTMKPSFDGHARIAAPWMPEGGCASSASRMSLTGCAPTASDNVPVTAHERFKPTVVSRRDNEYILDFGQNISGQIEFWGELQSIGHLHLWMAETLKDGQPDMARIQCRAGKESATPKQELQLILKPGQNHYRPRFWTAGFRYVRAVTDFELDSQSLTAIAIYSDMEETGVFDCSNPLINRFVENTRWSMKGNFLDVPTDCPTRERAGWTGDAQIFCRTGTYLMDTAAFFRKWLRDLSDRQTKKGKVHCIVPSVGNELYISRMDGCAGWADAAVLIPWQLYEMYGDVTILKECYPSMRAHMLFEIGRTNRTGLFGRPFHGPLKKYVSNVGQAFGEWLEPLDVYRQSILKDFCAPHPEEATAYLYWSALHMEKAARLLGAQEDEALFARYKKGCREAYNYYFAPGQDIITDRQSKLVRPLAMDILHKKAKKQVARRLMASIKKRNYRIGTGFLSTPLILPTLTKLGRPDIAYAMMENEDMPGWLYEVKAGATTVWEDWAGNASQNHYSPGSVCQWLFETVCGIRVTGRRTFTIAPVPGGHLSHASFSYQSIYGTVACRWERTAEGLAYTIQIPANTQANIHLPKGTCQKLTFGTWNFTEPSDNGRRMDLPNKH